MTQATQGWINGFLGMLIFSGSLVATRLAVVDLEPVFLTVTRATIAALLGAALLLSFRQAWPTRAQLLPLVIVALGVVVGFPLLTALALQTITAAHSTIYIGLLPLATAAFGVIRASEKPTPAFWLFSCLGSACVAGFAAYESGSAAAAGDIFMLAAIIVCGLGYAEGAALSRVLGGWQVISWSLLVALPVMAVIMIWRWPSSFEHVSLSAWAGFAYVSLFSMLIGFVFWYRGLALGGIAAVGQLQLLQPFFALVWAALILGESVSPLMLVVTVVVVVCVAASRHFATSRTKPA